MSIYFVKRQKNCHNNWIYKFKWAFLCQSNLNWNWLCGRGKKHICQFILMTGRVVNLLTRIKWCFYFMISICHKRFIRCNFLQFSHFFLLILIFNEPYWFDVFCLKGVSSTDSVHPWIVQVHGHICVYDCTYIKWHAK